jgi:hypothetical protein
MLDGLHVAFSCLRLRIMPEVGKDNSGVTWHAPQYNHRHLRCYVACASI